MDNGCISVPMLRRTISLQWGDSKHCARDEPIMNFKRTISEIFEHKQNIVTICNTSACIFVRCWFYQQPNTVQWMSMTDTSSCSFQRVLHFLQCNPWQLLHLQLGLEHEHFSQDINQSRASSWWDPLEKRTSLPYDPPNIDWTLNGDAEHSV